MLPCTEPLRRSPTGHPSLSLPCPQHLEKQLQRLRQELDHLRQQHAAAAAAQQGAASQAAEVQRLSAEVGRLQEVARGKARAAAELQQRLLSMESRHKQVGCCERALGSLGGGGGSARRRIVPGLVGREPIQQGQSRAFSGPLHWRPPSTPLCCFLQAEAALREAAAAKAEALADAEKRFRQLELVMRRLAAKREQQAQQAAGGKQRGKLGAVGVVGWEAAGVGGAEEESFLIGTSVA